MGKEVAEIVQLKGCFSLRPRRLPTLDVLTAASAAAKVLQDDSNPVMVWLDMEQEALFLTERWSGDVVTQRMPLSVEVQRLPKPVDVSAEETVVATAVFPDRDSVELFLKLSLQVLQDWLSIRQGALGRNLLMAQGHWILGYHGQALRLLCPGAEVAGLLRLNLSRPGIELLVAQAQEPVKTEVVSSMQLAGKALKKHAHARRLDKAVQQSIQSLQPCPQSLQQLKSRLDASARGPQAAANMQSWLDGGIIAALVDCAAALPAVSSLQQQRQQHEAAEVLRSVSDCMSLVLLHAEQQAAPQARLMLDCITRSLWGTQSQALNAAQLLDSMLQELAEGDSKLGQLMQQVCQDSVLLQQLQQRYSALLPTLRTAHGCASVSSRPWSHPVTWGTEPDEDSTADTSGHATSAQAAAASADGTSSPLRRPVVPRLSLPTSLPATPQVHLTRSIRLSCRTSDAASDCSGVRQAAAVQPGSAMSFVAALQQLGHSCGESVMAADLAAFVTHKLLHASDVAGSREQGKHSGAGHLAGAAAQSQPPCKQEPPLQEQLHKLPQPLQLQAHLLQCMHLIVQQLPAGAPLPRSLGHALLEHLLLPRALLQQQLGQPQQSEQALELWTQQQQHRSMQLLARCSQPPRCQHLLAADSGACNLTGSTLLGQFRQRLLDICGSRRPGGSSSVYEECRDALLLLHGYLRTAARPHIAEAACIEMGRALAQVEHVLRASRVSLWAWPAVQAMDALVQVYAELAQQVASPLAVSHLLQMLGSQQAGGSNSSSLAGAASYSSDGTAAALLPSDTLQLVLDVLQQRLPAGHASARGSYAGEAARSSAAAAGGYLHSAASAASSGAGSSTPAASTSRLGAARQAEGAFEGAAGEAAQGNTIKAHCWQLLTAVLQLAAQWHANRPDTADALSTTSSLSWYAANSSARRTSSMSTDLQLQKQQHAVARLGSNLGSSARSSSGGLDACIGDEHVTGVTMLSGESQRRQGQHTSMQPAAGGGHSNAEVQCAHGTAAPGSSSSSSSTPASAGRCTALQLDTVGLLAGTHRSAEAASAGSAAGQAGREALRLLVDLLLRQRGGRAYAVAQLDELDGSPAALPLQIEVLNFIASAFDVPNSYPLAVPQLAEFYVHYHLLHFTRHYYKLPTAPGQTVAACSKGHIRVLLALCRHTGGANLVRRRFLQLKVLDFVIRELSLEHSLLGRQQQHGAGSSSCATTPASTARSSARHTLRGLAAAGEGWTAAAAAGGVLQDEADAAEDVLTERGLSSLSSFGASQQAESEEQHGSVALAPAAEQQQQQRVATAATDSSSKRRADACSPLPDRKHGRREQPDMSAAAAVRLPAGDTAASCPGEQEGACGLQHKSCKAAAADAEDSPPHLRSVQSRVQKFEAAADAARAKAAAAATPPKQPRRPGSPEEALQNGADAAAAASSLPVLRMPQPPSEGGPGLALGPRARAAESLLAARSCRLNSSSSTGGEGSAAPSSGEPTIEQQASSDYEDDREPRGDCCSKPTAPLPDSKSPAKEKVAWQRLGSSSDGGSSSGGSSSGGSSSRSWDSAADTSARHCSAVSDRPRVPSLALGLPSSHAPAAAAAAVVAACSGTENEGAEDGNAYRPGFDLEEDFERIMEEEEAGGEGFWDFSSGCEDEDGSDCSSLIAAGYDEYEEEEEEQKPAPRKKPVLPPLRSAAAQGPDSSTMPRSCNHQAPPSNSEQQIPLGGLHRAVGAVAAAAVADGAPVHAAGEAAAAASGPAAAGDDASEDDDSLCEEQRLDDAVGLHEEEYGQEQELQEEHGSGSSHGIARSPGRRALVPHLNLPASQHAMLQLASPSSSTTSSARFAAAPSLLAAATPLVTSRPPTHTHATSNRAAADAHTTPQPASAAAAAAGGSTLRVRYESHRRSRAMYVDIELHVLCLELALHLLSSPSGMLDPLQLPQDPSDNALQHKVLVLLAHLSQPENAHVAQALADRAHAQMQPPAAASSCSAHSIPGAAAAHSDSGAAVLSGLAACTLRLLKLLCPAMLGAGRLQLVGMISQGAFSEVQAATLLQAGKRISVAAKLVGSAENDASCFERVHNEVAILESLQGHAGVVPLLDYGVLAGSRSNGLDALQQQQQQAQQPQWVLVFPRYSGSLRAWRQARGAGLRQQEVELYLRVFLQVASTVAALHACNVVHYDIKGDNLLLDTSSSSPSSSSSSRSSRLPFDVVLADFGDALMFDAAGSAFAQRHRGTELFSSPEMLLLHAGQQNAGHEQHDRRKHRGVGRAHDVWSLGCALYELLTGRVLFEQEGVGRITSYAPSRAANSTSGPSSSAAGGGSSSSGNVLNSRERGALAGHPGLIELVEFMLVGDAHWRPGAPEVVCRTQLLLATVEASAASSSS